MLCPSPSCSTQHGETALVLSERQGVEIDYCPRCRGVWLDRGELDKLIERALQEQTPTTPPAYTQQAPRQEQYRPHDKNYGHSDQYKYKKKKSLLSEIFDF